MPRRRSQERREPPFLPAPKGGGFRVAVRVNACFFGVLVTPWSIRLCTTPPDHTTARAGFCLALVLGPFVHPVAPGRDRWHKRPLFVIRFPFVVLPLIWAWWWGKTAWATYNHTQTTYAGTYRPNEIRVGATLLTLPDRPEPWSFPFARRQDWGRTLAGIQCKIRKTFP